MCRASVSVFLRPSSSLRSLCFPHFVIYGAFYEWKQYVLPLFGIFFRHATHRQPCALAHRPIPSAHRPTPRCPVSATPTHMLRICVNPRRTFICGRADNACTNLLGFFVRYVRTRGIVEAAESGKIADFHFVLCRTRLPRTARATNSCTRRVFFKRAESPLK